MPGEEVRDGSAGDLGRNVRAVQQLKVQPVNQEYYNLIQP